MKISLTNDDGSVIEFAPVVAPLVPDVQGVGLEDLQPVAVTVESSEPSADPVEAPVEVVEPVVEPVVEVPEEVVATE